MTKILTLLILLTLVVFGLFVFGGKECIEESCRTEVPFKQWAFYSHEQCMGCENAEAFVELLDEVIDNITQ